MKTLIDFVSKVELFEVKKCPNNNYHVQAQDF